MNILQVNKCYFLVDRSQIIEQAEPTYPSLEKALEINRITGWCFKFAKIF